MYFAGFLALTFFFLFLRVTLYTYCPMGGTMLSSKSSLSHISKSTPPGINVFSAKLNAGSFPFWKNPDEINVNWILFFFM